MSPRERNIWLRLASILIVFVPYFLHVLSLFRSDGPISRALCIAFLVAAVAHALLNALGQIAMVLVFGNEIRDERDGAIDAMSSRVAYFALISLVLGAIGTLAFTGAITPSSSTGTFPGPTWATTSQCVFFSIVVAEVLRHLVQLFCYRREAAA